MTMVMILCNDCFWIKFVSLDNIKICDFGMATLFRHNGIERMLSNRCGTLPYMAPEVCYSKEFKAQPTDM